MKNNTGCGNGHSVCPTPATHKVKSISMPGEFDVFSGGKEKTVVLGNVFVQSLTEADIHLPTHAREIKHIKKNVSLTQCKAIPDALNDKTVNLFIEGVVHKNIQYVESSFGVVRDFSVDIPFKAFDRIRLKKEVESDFSIKDNILQTRQLAHDKMGADRCEFGSLTFEINNEPIECKLLASAVNQWDISNNFDNWSRFKTITEKMDVILAIQLSQKQFYPSSSSSDSEDIHDKFKNFIKI